MKLKIKDRVSLIVYVYSLRQASNLKKYGDLKYVSKRMHYVILYVDKSQLSPIKKRISHLNFVKKIYDSSLSALSKELSDRTIKESVKEGD